MEAKKDNCVQRKETVTKKELREMIHQMKEDSYIQVEIGEVDVDASTKEE